MKRRAFILNSLGAIAAAPGIFAGGPGDRIRIGQIGVFHAHASGKMDAMRRLADRFDVVGVTERDASLRDAVTGKAPYLGVRVLSEEELLASPGLAAVAVETRVEDSTATALRCIRAGKHVHLDKPGGLDHASFKAMRIEAERRGLTVQMGYMLRYNPAFEFLFQAARDGWLGEITEIDVAMGKLADPDTRQTIGALRGGGMFELGGHMIDAVVTLLGKPSSVQSHSTPTTGDGVKDNQLAVLQYPKATVTLRCNHADPFGGPRRRFAVAGTKGMFEIRPMESGNVTLGLTEAHGKWSKGVNQIQLTVPPGRYDGEFIDLAKIIRGEKSLAWTAGHDITVHETLLLAAGLDVGSG
ncbi:MAG TPA: Gfo/Idh/MocA family oxidoreductase [Verrucomicrobiae bacterium]|nr:Gfo/Idh/MocA family oxidoreductase [Verrucomicrobiae bacterium]